MSMFLYGATAMGCLIAGLFFLRFWHQSRDRLFVSFAVAFWVFALNYVVLGLVPLATERRPYVFLLRLAGFVTILWGIVHKSRDNSRR